MELSERIRNAVRDVEDFPKEGIVFKDIAPILLDSYLCKAIIDELYSQLELANADIVCGIESRGFLFGPALAMRAGLPFVPIRKAGKLPGNVVSQHYSLEYGSATIEMQSGIIGKGSKVFLHDDLIATGGTARAAIELIRSQGADVEVASFLIGLNHLPGIRIIRNMGVRVGQLLAC